MSGCFMEMKAGFRPVKIMEIRSKLKVLGIKSLVSKLKLFFKECFSFFRNDFFRDHAVLWILVLSLLANLSMWLFLFLFLHSIDSNIILHYNVYFGVDMTGSWKQTLFFPAIGVVLFIINLWLAVSFYSQSEKTASFILLSAVLMIQLSLLIASVSIVMINY